MGYSGRIRLRISHLFFLMLVMVDWQYIIWSVFPSKVLNLSALMHGLLLKFRWIQMVSARDAYLQPQPKELRCMNCMAAAKEGASGSCRTSRAGMKQSRLRYSGRDKVRYPSGALYGGGNIDFGQIQLKRITSLNSIIR